MTQRRWTRTAASLHLAQNVERGIFPSSCFLFPVFYTFICVCAATTGNSTKFLGQVEMEPPGDPATPPSTPRLARCPRQRLPRVHRPLTTAARARRRPSACRGPRDRTPGVCAQGTLLSRGRRWRALCGSTRGPRCAPECVPQTLLCRPTHAWAPKQNRPHRRRGRPGGGRGEAGGGRCLSHRGCSVCGQHRLNVGCLRGHRWQATEPLSTGHTGRPSAREGGGQLGDGAGARPRGGLTSWPRDSPAAAPPVPAPATAPGTAGLGKHGTDGRTDGQTDGLLERRGDTCRF